MRSVVPIFRVFFSSTFADLADERAAMHERVFPLLRDFCRRRGARFQAIDLRWGVSQEAGRDQRTMQVCLNEIKRCQRITPRPNFVVLLGYRYGWRPLPSKIPVQDFDYIRETARADASKLALDILYPQVDWNAVPAVYCLRVRTKELDPIWEALESDAQAIFREVAQIQGLSSSVRESYAGSATEQEVFHGLLSEDVFPNARDYVHAFFLEVEGFLSDSSSQKFLDWTPRESDLVARNSLEILKDRLRTSLPPGNVHSYQVVCSDQGIRAEHIGQVTTVDVVASGNTAVTGNANNICQDIYDSLVHIIDRELSEERELIDSNDLEKIAHDQFARQRGDERFFTGRVAPLRTIADYIVGTSNCPFALFGPAGSGKSSVLSRALLDASKRWEGATVVARFIGITPDSSNTRALLASLSTEIARSYGVATPAPETDILKLSRIYREQLQYAKLDKPLILFFDGLDQISDQEVQWLPLDGLPEYVRLVISAVSGDSLWATRITAQLPADHIITLDAMDVEEGGRLLDRWLNEAHRSLQAPQQALILERFRQYGWPLYIRLAFEEARFWRSFEGAVELAPDLPSLVRQTYSRLASPANHGDALVRGG